MGESARVILIFLNNMMRPEVALVTEIETVAQKGGWDTRLGYNE